MKNYIQKILQNISSIRISSDALVKMTDLMHCIIDYLVHVSLVLNPAVLDAPVLVQACRITFTGDLLRNILLEGEAKHALTIHPSYFQKYLQNVKTPGVKPTYDYILYLSAVIEYICAEILKLSLFQARKRTIYNIGENDIVDSILSDRELRESVRHMRIEMLKCTYTPIYSKKTFQTLVRNIVGGGVKITKDTFLFLHAYMDHYLQDMLLVV